MRNKEGYIIVLLSDKEGYIIFLFSVLIQGSGMVLVGAIMSFLKMPHLRHLICS